MGIFSILEVLFLGKILYVIVGTQGRRRRAIEEKAEYGDEGDVQTKGVFGCNGGVSMTFTVGQSGSLTKTIPDDDVRRFAQVVGDNNPVHLDDAFAKQTRFGRRIAHGMLTASLISAVLGNKFPGPGTIYLSQSLQFKGPVYIGDTITATVTITKTHETKPILTLATVCVNERGEEVLNGEAVVLYEPISKTLELPSIRT